MAHSYLITVLLGSEMNEPSTTERSPTKTSQDVRVVAVGGAAEESLSELLPPPHAVTSARRIEIFKKTGDKRVGIHFTFSTGRYLPTGPPKWPVLDWRIRGRGVRSDRSPGDCSRG